MGTKSFPMGHSSARRVPVGRLAREERSPDGIRTYDTGRPDPSAIERSHEFLPAKRIDVKVLPETAGVSVYWLPLGAGGRSIRWNGRVFEALVARHQRRSIRDLYHSALEVHLGTERFVIEMTPVWGQEQVDRGVVRRGTVGSPWLGHSAAFRYEVRRWLNGTIPDVAEAVDSPQRLSADPIRARRLLDLVPLVPALTWGRDEAHTGDMWNSNSLTSWLLASSEHDVTSLVPPTLGRAPGWHAGLAVARSTVGVTQ